MNKYSIATLIAFLSFGCIQAQVTLDADGPGNTYELINSVLAPGYSVIEAPDCSHPEFGRHIDEIWDDTLGMFVFRFHIHVTPDNDRCINFDRQRNEIKTYDKSPDNLKAVEGELFEYKWKFKLDSAFQPSPSFTHIHQLKAVGGSEESMPLITLTPRKTNKMQLRYAKNTSQTTIKQVELEPFLGEWVEVYEKVKFGEVGVYELVITRLSDNKVIMEYSSNTKRMWKTGASFIRPKWGIYRSLNYPEDLRDEKALFANFSIEEIDATPVEMPLASNRPSVYPNPASHLIELKNLEAKNISSLNIFDSTGRLVSSKQNNFEAKIDISNFKNGIYIVNIHYRNGQSFSSRFVKLK